MFLLIVFIVICSQAFGSPLYQNGFKFNKGERIIGGELASILGAPWQVALLKSSGTNYRLSCGASIITPTVFLSAAHCIYDTTPAQWLARVGSSEALNGGQTLNIRNTTMHELYLYNTTYHPFEYDIGLFMTYIPVDMTNPMVSIVSLPYQDQYIADGTVGLITGWGSETFGPIVEDLRKANISAVNQQKCYESFGELVSETMLCLGDYEQGGVGTCGGDSGGPFVVDGILFGVTSWGAGCARPLYPSVFTRVPSFRNWINDNVLSI